MTWTLFILTVYPGSDRPDRHEHGRYPTHEGADQVGRTLRSLYPWVVGHQVELRRELCPRCRRGDRIQGPPQAS